MKRYNLFFIPLFMAVAVSCAVDTYDLPGETICGTLRDADGNQLITEQPNGFTIRLQESGASTYIDFWGKPDGTYRNTKVFAGRYTVEPRDGAFFPVDPVEVDIEGELVLDFEIVPYLYIDNVSIQAVKDDITATYSIRKSRPDVGKISMARLLVSKWNPNLGMNYMDYEAAMDLSGIDDSEIEGQVYTQTVENILESGVTYYARVAALATNSAGRYNFSPVFELKVL